MLAYFIAVSERSSLGIAAPLAAERFGVEAAQLSLLTVFQLAVYALMQIPVGLLLDRFGSKKLLIWGGVLMAAGQVLVAVSGNFTGAILGRSLLGIGDACTFISMIRLINYWYSGPSATRRTQLYANIGQLGQVFSAFPFAFALAHLGWSNSFLALGAFAALGALLTFLFIEDAPVIPPASESGGQSRAVWLSLKSNLLDPAVRMAFWTHFTMQFPGSVFVLLWGYTFLVKGEGLEPSFASALLASFVGVGFAVGPVLSHICATRPDLRHWLVNAIAASTVMAWGTVLLWPGRAPIAALVVLVLVLGVGGPASMIAFDFTRSFVPVGRLGSANGVANIGGFAATFATMFVVGALLDLRHRMSVSDPVFSLDGFKVSLSAQFLLIAVGLFAFHRERRRLLQTRNKVSETSV